MTDALPSWNETAVKAAIVAFVEKVTRDGSPDYLPPAERIATFDNDGTLWCEQPVQVQVLFAGDRLQQLAEQRPELKAQEPYRSYLARDIASMKALGKKGLMEIAAATHAGLSASEMRAAVRAWLKTAVHPVLKRPHTEVVYQPMLELLDYLRANGFLVFIVTGGGADVVRTLSEQVYGVPRHMVVGSAMKVQMEERDGRMEIQKLPELLTFDDREVKPENIEIHIGRRPVLAFGNSDGDLAMLRYTLTGEGPRLGLLLHHDDAEREFAYDRDFKLSPLAEALDQAGAYGISLVSMARDWRKVFPQA
ncbi:HAD family hydrolase [Sandaracinobacteroides hominis]|uniref:HAD family hydrolase n=1 Tax=Sandaracinobacteroides hominis TaxID=2780086 RepID=UPI0018F385D2|nr:HAD family hydrolase [Sandaracinobacteroides hominis]